MFRHLRAPIVGAVSLSLLGACGVSSYGTSSGTVASVSGGGTGSTTGGTVGGLPAGGERPVGGTHDTVMATPPSSMISVVVGAKLTVPVTFTSSDGNSISGFAINNSLGGSLPPGWSGPQTFNCATLSTGSGCVLNLVYQPTAYSVGQQVALSYVYIDNANEPTAGTSHFNFQATTNDNVVGTPAPVGQINATIGAGSQSVTVTFVTDDGNPASALAVTSPSTLPTDWSGPASPSCATVSAGTACTLTYTYQPTMPASGTLALNFAYDNDSGTGKSGSVNIPYAATANNNIVGFVFPTTSPINVVSGNTQTVTVAFVTDDSFDAYNLMATTDSSTLQPNWMSASPSFSCATVNSGTACQLTLTYTPAAPGESGTQSINYSYNDNAGTPKSGMVNINYTSS
jgi:hypothetical protein